MKIKTDHITNSSSVSYIFSISEEDYDGVIEALKEIENMPDASNEGVSIRFECETKKELDEYVNDGPLDWAQKPRGPSFEYMSEPQYKAALEILEEGHTVMELSIDWNVYDKVQQEFRDIIKWEGN